MDGRPTWTDCDEAGDYVVPYVLSPRDLVSRPDNMDETVPHTQHIFAKYQFLTFQIIIIKNIIIVLLHHFRLVIAYLLLLSFRIIHYANMSAQYTAIFHGYKNDNFQIIFFVIFLIFAQNIDCGYTLEPHQ